MTHTKRRLHKVGYFAELMAGSQEIDQSIRPLLKLSRERGPGILIYVVMTAEAVVGSTGALRRRMAAEMRVMMRPTGRGSMKV